MSQKSEYSIEGFNESIWKSYQIIQWAIYPSSNKKDSESLVKLYYSNNWIIYAIVSKIIMSRAFYSIVYTNESPHEIVSIKVMNHSPNRIKKNNSESQQNSNVTYSES